MINIISSPTYHLYDHNLDHPHHDNVLSQCSLLAPVSLCDAAPAVATSDSEERQPCNVQRALLYITVHLYNEHSLLFTSL